MNLGLSDLATMGLSDLAPDLAGTGLYADSNNALCIDTSVLVGACLSQNGNALDVMFDNQSIINNSGLTVKCDPNGCLTIQSGGVAVDQTALATALAAGGLGLTSWCQYLGVQAGPGLVVNNGAVQVWPDGASLGFSGPGELVVQTGDGLTVGTNGLQFDYSILGQGLGQFFNKIIIENSCSIGVDEYNAVVVLTDPNNVLTITTSGLGLLWGDSNTLGMDSNGGIGINATNVAWALGAGNTNGLRFDTPSQSSAYRSATA